MSSFNFLACHRGVLSREILGLNNIGFIGNIYLVLAKLCFQSFVALLQTLFLLSYSCSNSRVDFVGSNMLFLHRFKTPFSFPIILSVFNLVIDDAGEKAEEDQR